MTLSVVSRRPFAGGAHTNQVGGKCPLPRYREPGRRSWHVANRLPTGTRVYDIQDRRHVGRLEAILNTSAHRVVFDNGFWADIPEHRVCKAEDGE